MSKHAIITRRYSQDKESYEYSLSDDAESVSAAENKAAHMRGVPGDIVIVCDMAHVTDLHKHAKTIYIIGGSGKARKAPKLPKRIEYAGNWLSAWEGPEAKADNMLGVALKLGVDIKLIVLAGYECFSAVIKYISFCKSDVILATELAKSWTAGKVDITEIRSRRIEIQKSYKILQSKEWRIPGLEAASLSALAAAESLMDIIISQKEGEEIASSIPLDCSYTKGQYEYVVSYHTAGILNPIKYTQEQQKSISDLSEQVRSIIPLELVLFPKKR